MICGTACQPYTNTVIAAQARQVDHSAPLAPRCWGAGQSRRQQLAHRRQLASSQRQAALQQQRCCTRPRASTSPVTEVSAASTCSIGRNILVAVDSSKDSRYALEWTVREVYRPGDIIHVAHCIPFLPVAGGMYAAPDGRLALVDVDQLLAREEQYLMAEQQAVEAVCAEVFQQQQQVAHVVDILREESLGGGEKGRIAEALCHKAEELQAAAVVIASHTKSGLSEFLLGSVAAHCTLHSNQPVLVLHAPQQEQEGLLGKLAHAASAVLGGRRGQSQEAQEQAVGAAAGSEQQGSAAGAGGAPAAATAAGAQASAANGSAGSEGRNIVLAVDDSDASENACLWALQNLCRPDDTFHLLRIIPTLPFRATYGGPVLDGMVFYMEPSTDAFKSATERFVQHRFEPKLKEAGVRYEVDILVEDTDESVAGVGRSICEKAEDLNAAVVVLGSHTSGELMQFLLGSVATFVSHNCKRPVAVLH